jgi:hypothetical protein
LGKKTHATLSPRSAAAGSRAVHKIERRYCFLKRFILRYLLGAGKSLLRTSFGALA